MSKIIEAITKSQLRSDIPEFKAGDTVRVHVRIVEGGREEFLLLILYVKFQTVLGLKEHSLFTLQKLKKLKLYVKVKLDVLNYTTYVTYVVKLLVLEKYDNKNKRRSPITLCFRVFFFILNIFYIIYH